VEYALHTFHSIRDLHVSGDLKLHQYRRFENEYFLLAIQREKMAFSSVFFVSRVMVRDCESSGETHSKFDARKRLHFHLTHFGTFPRSR
jgi:hypothetical protein